MSAHSEARRSLGPAAGGLTESEDFILVSKGTQVPVANTWRSVRPSEVFPPQGAEPVLLDVAEGVVTFTAASPDSVSCAQCEPALIHQSWTCWFPCSRFGPPAVWF